MTSTSAVMSFLGQREANGILATHVTQAGVEAMAGLTAPEDLVAAGAPFVETLVDLRGSMLEMAAAAALRVPDVAHRAQAFVSVLKDAPAMLGMSSQIAAKVAMACMPGTPAAAIAFARPFARLLTEDGELARAETCAVALKVRGSDMVRAAALTAALEQVSHSVGDNASDVPAYLVGAAVRAISFGGREAGATAARAFLRAAVKENLQKSES